MTAESLGIIYVKYVCVQCGAEDTDKLLPHTQPASVINCWKCKAGLNMAPAEMFATNVGMFPIPPELPVIQSMEAQA